MTTITLHGKMGEDLGKEWELEVFSVNEALRALEANTRKLRKWIIDNKNYEYYILVNKNLLNIKKDIPFSEIFNSELFAKYPKNKLNTIDIIPSIDGAGLGDFLSIAAGIGGIAMGMTAGSDFNPIPKSMAPSFILGGISLISVGVTNLLAKPPQHLTYQAQQATTQTQGAVGQNGGPQSYLFNGPINLVGEGGPVPVGYGQLMIGSTTSNVYYENTYVTNRRTTITTESDVRFLHDSSYGFQNYFNEQASLISQSSSYVV